MDLVSLAQTASSPAPSSPTSSPGSGGAPGANASGGNGAPAATPQAPPQAQPDVQVRKQASDPGIAHRQSQPAPEQPPQQPTDRVRVGDLELSADELKGLLERKGLEDSKRATLPATAADYRLELPQDFKPPQGLEFKLDPADPAFAQAAEFAHAAGLSQEQFSKMVGIYAGLRVAEAKFFQDTMQKEIAALGAAGPSRVTAIRDFLRGHLGDELAAPFFHTLVTEAQVRGWEKLMMHMATQGVGAMTQQHREPPQQKTTISDERWNAMSPGERIDYARGFDQSQFTNGGRQ
jgi:hypothetical protein